MVTLVKGAVKKFKIASSARSVRGSARSAQVERALRVRFRL